MQNISAQIKQWARELGFQQAGICNTDLTAAEQHLHHWLANGYHGDMAWMAKHGNKRSRPDQLVPGTLRVISVRMNYYPEDFAIGPQLLEQPEQAFVSRYALGRDYHKLMRQRLKKLAQRITQHVGRFSFRVFVDSAPVLEKPLAQKAGLGWIGKHTNVINRDAGSWFFLGELYTNLPLEVDTPAQDHCGTCQACIDSCPTRAIIAPYELDARRCISYLTIEHKGAIPNDLRKAMGNRIYGCDDCQQVCPWNRFARLSDETDFQPRQQLDNANLLALFAWDETTFLRNTEGSAIRRIGYERWQRNLAVALGNATTGKDKKHIITALEKSMSTSTPLVNDHIAWALQQLKAE